MNSELFMITAYAVIWGGILGYVFWAGRQQSLLRRRVTALEELNTEIQNR